MIEALRLQIVQTRELLQELELLDDTAPPFHPGRLLEAWGRSESFDPDNVGDIADEGLGHRG